MDGIYIRPTLIIVKNHLIKYKTAGIEFLKLFISTGACDFVTNC